MIKLTTKNCGEVLYDAPSVNVLDVQSEGLLCASGAFTIKNWEDDSESLDF
jgi:hypothetical protein